MGGRLLLVFLVLVSLGIAPLGHAAGDDEQIGPFRVPAGELPWTENEVALLLTPSATEADVQALNEEFGSTVVFEGRYTPGLYKLWLPRPVDNSVLAAMNSKPFVLVAERVYKFYPTAVPDDTYYPAIHQSDDPSRLWGQWALQPDTLWDKQHIYAPEAWDIIKGKNDVVVAVLDTGVRDRVRESGDHVDRFPHPDLGYYCRYCPTDRDLYAGEAAAPGVRWAGRLLVGEGYDFTSKDPTRREDPSPSESTNIDVLRVSWHGTWVAGIIAAKTNNSEGVAGLAWSDVWILPLKIYPDSGASFDQTALVEALRYCVEWRSSAIVQGANLRVDVANMSFGGTRLSSMVRHAIAEAASRGIILVASAGNQGNLGPYPPLYPASFDRVIGVGSTGPKDTISAWSSRGNGVDIVAPGDDIVSTWWSRQWVDNDGINQFYLLPRFCDPTLPRQNPPSKPPSVGDRQADIWGNGYGRYSGTSASAAMVSAAAGLLRSLDVPSSDVELILRETATPTGVGRPNDAYGWGLLNVYKAVRMACIDVRVQSPTQSGIVPTKRPKLRVDFRHADPETISIWVDPVDSNADGVPDNAPVLTGTDPTFTPYYFVVDPAAGKSYVEFEYQLTPGTHTIYAKAQSDMELDTPPPTPLTDDDKASFTVVPQTLRRGWHLLSIPFKFDIGTTPEDLFFGNIGMLARWHYANSTSAEYAIYSLDGSRTDPEASFAPPSVLDEAWRLEEKVVHPLGLPFDATPPAGLGYWAYLAEPIEFPEWSGEAVDKVPYVISLYRGWNMVGNPFPFMIDWGSAVVEYAGMRAPVAEAVQNGWLFAYTFRYDNIYRQYTSGRIDGSTMRPWEGQWVRVLARGPNGWPEPDLKLIVSPNPYTGIPR